MASCESVLFISCCMPDASCKFCSLVDRSVSIHSSPYLQKLAHTHIVPTTNMAKRRPASAIMVTSSSKPKVDPKFIADSTLWDPATPREEVRKKRRPISAPVYKRSVGFRSCNYSVYEEYILSMLHACLLAICAENATQFPTFSHPHSIAFSGEGTGMVLVFLCPPVDLWLNRTCSAQHHDVANIFIYPPSSVFWLYLYSF